MARRLQSESLVPQSVTIYGMETSSLFTRRFYLPSLQGHKVPPIRMDQAMSIAAIMVAATIRTFGRPEDSPEELAALHQTCLAVFLHQLLMPTKHKETMAKILESLIIELRKPEQANAQPNTPSI